MKVRGQPAELLLSFNQVASWDGINSGQQAWQQEPLLAETSHQPVSLAVVVLGRVAFQGASSLSVYFQFQLQRILYLWNIGDNLKGHSTARNRAPMRHLFEETLSKALEEK